MKRINYLKVALLAALAMMSTPHLEAQHRGPISHHTNERDKDDEYRMSHLDADAGDLIGLVLPKRLMEMPIKSGRWEPAESGMAKVVEYTSTSANIRLLHSGTTVVNYKYKFMKDGKEESASYPFTIRIHRLDPEIITLPSTLYVGLGSDVSKYLRNEVRMQPEFSEASLAFSIDDPDIAHINEGYSGTQITGTQLGETTIHVETGNGLQTEARVIVVIPAVTDLDIKSNEGKKLSVGDQVQLDVKITPRYAQPMLKWTSDKPGVIKVDENGLVTAVSEGKATIRVVAENGEKDSITLKVVK